jgi:hypothetical protein
MKRNLYLLLSVILIILSFNFIVSAADFSLETGTIAGDTTYIISGPQSGGFKSELIFPIEQPVLKFSYRLPLNRYKIADLNFSYLKNTESESGIFIDSDWLYSYSSEKAIYSESDSYLDFYQADLKVNFLPFYNFKSGKSFLSLSGGYQQQDFDFDIQDLEQINYLSGREAIVAGQVLTYQIEYNFPYLAFNWRRKTGQQGLNCSLSFGFSPFLKAEDRDDHVLRDKLSYIDAEGTAVLAEADLNYKFNRSFSLFAAWNYLKMEAEGTQVQKNYSGDILFEDIDAELSSKQNIISGGVTIAF